MINKEILQAHVNNAEVFMSQIDAFAVNQAAELQKIRNNVGEFKKVLEQILAVGETPVEAEDVSEETPVDESTLNDEIDKAIDNVESGNGDSG